MKKLFKVEWNTSESGFLLNAQVSKPICTWSTKNIVAFTSGYLESREENPWVLASFVHVICPEYPWEIYHIETGFKEPVGHVIWDRSGTRLLVIDSNSSCKVFKMQNNFVNTWECIHKFDIESRVVCAAWLDSGMNLAFDVIKPGHTNLLEKFSRKSKKPPITDIAGQGKDGFIVVSESGIAHVILLEKKEQKSQKKLFMSRCRVLLGDICFKDDGKVHVVLVTDQRVAEFFIIALKMVNMKIEMSIEISPCIVPHVLSDEEYATYSISCVKFIIEENIERILVCTESCGVTYIKYFELKIEIASLQYVLQRMAQNLKVLSVKEWFNIKSFSLRGQCSCVALAKLTSNVADLPFIPALVFVSKDGVMHQLPSNLSGIHQSVDVSKNSLSFQDETISVVTFSPNETCILTISDKGNVAVFQVASLDSMTESVAIRTCVNLFEYCLVAGHSSWDVIVASASLGDKFVEQCSQFLKSNIQSQPSMTQERISLPFAQMQADIYKSLDGFYFGAVENYYLLMLKSIYCYLHSTEKEAQLLMKIKVLCNGQLEIDLPKMVQLLEIKDLNINSSFVSSVQHLVQWVACYAIHICKLIFPSDREANYKQLLSVLNIQGLKTLQEILALIYIWGQVLPGWQPHFLQSANPLDILNQVFKLVSKLCLKFTQGDYTKENINPEEIPMRSHPMMYETLSLYDPKCGIISQSRFQLNDFEVYEFATEKETITNGRNYFLPHPMMVQVDMYKNFAGEFFFDGINLVTSTLLSGEGLKQCMLCSCVTLSKVSPSRNIMSSWTDQWTNACFCGGAWRSLDGKKKGSDVVKKESLSSVSTKN